MKKLPIEIILKISSYYPSPELTAANFCDIKNEFKNKKLDLVKKIINEMINDVIEDILNSQYL